MKAARSPAVQLGDTVRYKPGGRPDAVVAKIEPNGFHVEYAHPWEHPGLARVVVAQFIGLDERGDWKPSP